MTAKSGDVPSGLWASLTFGLTHAAGLLLIWVHGPDAKSPLGTRFGAAGEVVAAAVVMGAVAGVVAVVVGGVVGGVVAGVVAGVVEGVVGEVVAGVVAGVV